MESQLIINILTFLSVVVVASHAAVSTPMESYWNSELPNTPMPQAIKDSLSRTSEWLEEKGTSVVVGKGGVNVHTPSKGKPSGGTRVNVGHGGVGVYTGGKPGHPRTNVGVGKGGVSVGTGGKHHHKPVHVKVGHTPFDYNYAATEDQLHDNRNVAVFFKPTALQKGNTMSLHFTKTGNDAVFVQRTEAEKIPFSSQQMGQILNRFSVTPGSEEAQVMKQTIEECEVPAVKGEEKQCATSLESMVDFSKSKLGKKVRPIATETAEGKTSSVLQKYTISGVEKLQNKNKIVVCHKQTYAYAVFYCHESQTTEAYSVSLVGENGAKVKAAAVCHKDTSGWNPKHLAFQVLKVKPGTVPVCHFLPEDHIVWVAN